MKILYPIVILLCLTTSINAEVRDFICLVRVQSELDDRGGSGSGIILEGNRVLTAYHVIDKVHLNDLKVRVEFQNKISPAKLLAVDIPNDLALLQINDLKNKEYATIVDTIPKLKQNVISWGHPKARWRVHKGFGHITKVDGKEYIASMIILGGMSGGALTNNDGKVIAMIRAKSVSGPNLGYFVKGKHIKEFLSDIE
jgi:S1-C subfamily serine protease